MTPNELTAIGLIVVLILLVLRFKYKVDSRFPFILGMLMLFGSTLAIVLAFPDIAHDLGVVAFLCLLLGLILFLYDESGFRNNLESDRAKRQFFGDLSHRLPRIRK